MFRRFLNIRLLAAAAISAAVAIAPVTANAQNAPSTGLRILIDGTVAGTATAAENLPTAGTVLHQDNDSTLPSKQLVASGQGTVIFITNDASLVTAMQAWMKADNSGYKDTVQRKTVEVDRMTASGTGARYRLSGSWPTKIEAGDGGSMITVVYQSLAPIP